MIDELQRQLGLVRDAPGVTLALAASAAAAAWWLAGRLHGAKIAGQEQHLATREERVKLAEERARDQRERREEVERLFARLPPEVVTQLGPAFVGSFKQLGDVSGKLEAAVISATLRASEAPDTASMRVDAR